MPGNDDVEMVPVPHLSWRGPEPLDRKQAYALAVIVRLVDTKFTVRKKRTPDMKPSPLTKKNIDMVTTLYAYTCHELKVKKAASMSDVMTVMAESDKEEMNRWLKNNQKVLLTVKAGLKDMICTPDHNGFVCYG